MKCQFDWFAKLGNQINYIGVDLYPKTAAFFPCSINIIIYKGTRGGVHPSFLIAILFILALIPRGVSYSIIINIDRSKSQE